MNNWFLGVISPFPPVTQKDHSFEVDESCANILKIEVSDGIIAPSFTPAAFSAGFICALNCR